MIENVRNYIALSIQYIHCSNYVLLAHLSMRYQKSPNTKRLCKMKRDIKLCVVIGNKV